MSGDSCSGPVDSTASELFFAGRGPDFHRVCSQAIRVRRGWSDQVCFFYYHHYNHDISRMAPNLGNDKNNYRLRLDNLQNSTSEKVTKLSKLQCSEMNGNWPIMKEVNDCYNEKQTIITRSPVIRVMNC